MRKPSGRWQAIQEICKALIAKGCPGYALVLALAALLMSGIVVGSAFAFGSSAVAFGSTLNWRELRPTMPARSAPQPSFRVLNPNRHREPILDHMRFDDPRAKAPEANRSRVHPHGGVVVRGADNLVAHGS